MSTRTACPAVSRRALALLLGAALFLPAPAAHATIAWDAGGGSNWWFDPTNWDSPGDNLLPPTAATIESTDSQINIGLGAWDTTGEGVVYDPAGDPFFAAAGALSFPAGKGPQVIDRFYLSHNSDVTNLLTIKSGSLELGESIIGRSGDGGVGGAADGTNFGVVVQHAGDVAAPVENLTLGSWESAGGRGNGVWDYHSGTLNVATNNGDGIFLSAPNAGGEGAGGHGRLIVHNPASGGFVRTWDLNVAASGAGDGVDSGVGVLEYHFENGATRPIQIDNQLTLGNGATAGGALSSRLELNLGEVPLVDEAGVPNSLGLLEQSKSNVTVGSAGADGGQLSSADGSVLYGEGDTVSASFAGVTYDWTISYTGSISYSDRNNSLVAAIGGAGSGNDVVLIGAGSEGLSGDFNGDGIVNAIDYAVWRDGVVDPFDATEDYNQDLQVDFGDFTTWKGLAGSGFVAAEYDAWAANYGATSEPPMPMPIPEPATAALALLAAAGLAAARRR